ncbi:MAG: SRPBCC domain-containing protein [Nocardioides sp.]|nr:SRPBCC domain-containing protein [Nocardioidaceae bacterium]MCB8956754.1 SRPBCC domain-containing protein [Nocardioides sp.]
MEHGRIEREIHIDASPEVVFDVVSNPVHVRQWWPDEADYAPEPGGAGRIGFRQGDGSVGWAQIEVVDAVPSRLFSFRWTHPEGEAAGPGNSMLVVFELEARRNGTVLRMTETGFRERGWDEATVAAEYRDHVSGWDHFLPRLPDYVAEVAA